MQQGNDISKLEFSILKLKSIDQLCLVLSYNPTWTNKKRGVSKSERELTANCTAVEDQANNMHAALLYTFDNMPRCESIIFARNKFVTISIYIYNFLWQKYLSPFVVLYIKPDTRSLGDKFCSPLGIMKVNPLQYIKLL